MRCLMRSLERALDGLMRAPDGHLANLANPLSQPWDRYAGGLTRNLMRSPWVKKAEAATIHLMRPGTRIRFVFEPNPYAP